VDLETLSKVKVVIGVAGDKRKSPAILGALRGKLLSVLITDDRAAQDILVLHRKTA
jgi:DNA-binding transcriptional regulator LsrR (DeoR family)